MTKTNSSRFLESTVFCCQSFSEMRRREKGMVLQQTSHEDAQSVLTMTPPTTFTNSMNTCQTKCLASKQLVWIILLTITLHNKDILKTMIWRPIKCGEPPARIIGTESEHCISRFVCSDTGRKSSRHCNNYPMHM